MNNAHYDEAKSLAPCFSICPNCRLRELCIENNWFDHGSNDQYDKLFRANEELAPIMEIATIIWLCSDAPRRDILATLREEQVKYNTAMTADSGTV